MKSRALLLLLLLLLAFPREAWSYGYAADEDPLLLAFKAAIPAARKEDWKAARALAAKVRWQLDELRSKDDLRVDFRERFARDHGAPSSAGVIRSWVNLLYLALLQKLHWNLKESLAKYHPARARLDAAQTYYESALAGNVRRDDAARKAKDEKAKSRHDDLIAQFEVARQALGSPGLLGAGKRAPDLAAFRTAARRIAGHLRAVFPDFVHPGDKRKSRGGGGNEAEKSDEPSPTPEGKR